ncbi:sigma 54 modulation/S30EA ribosomal C-terminal domain-containing protein [Kitasatospora sp. NPDC059571]|uniref:sigma 54 modulation/S30EA ribosomal C-terminal domain-containing protein n=1 Tax=Kitasatospora sp. NPDC059571 TaxID=3346871 RepID=UPI0036845A44
MNRTRIRPAVEVLVEVRGQVSLAAPDYARTKLLAVLERLDEPILAARVKLTQEPNHAVARPSLAQATVDLNGRPVRAHVAAATMQEAVDLLRDRLTARLARMGRHRDHHPGATDDHRPQRRARRAEDRRIERHKAYSLARRSVRAAVFEMEAMDYDFHLFTDEVSGCDSVVYRDPATGGHLVVAAGPPPEPAPGLSVSTAGVPALTVGDAAERLDLSGLPFVFFTDAATGRGNVLYHR